MHDSAQPRKRRVLIVEDEPMVALSLEMLLEISDFESAGIAPTVEEALRLLSEGGCDVAILDINLGGKSSNPVAEALQKAAIPFIVVSGYDSDQQRDRFPANTRFLQKPCRPEALIEALRAAPP